MTEPVDPNALPPQFVTGEQPYVAPYAPPPQTAPPPPYGAPYSPAASHQPVPARPAPGMPASYPSTWDDLAPPTGRRVSTWVWVLGVVAVVLVVLAVSTVAAHESGVNDAKDTEGRTLALPQAVSGYNKVQTLDVADLLSQLGGSLSGLGVGAAQLDRLLAALYARPAAPEPSFVVIGMQVSDIPELQREIAAHGVAAAVKDFADGAALSSGSVGSLSGDMKSVAPGPLGGSMRCGLLSVGAREVGLCSWGDRSAFAVCMLLDPTSMDEAATLTRQFRAAAEH